MLELVGNAEIVLLGTTATLAVGHTLLGIDHSLPFIVLGRSRSWTLRHTVAITALCGVGHVASSVVIGLVGVAVGLTLDSLVWFESIRGELAAVLLIGFGLIYTAWAGWQRLRNRAHSHSQTLADGTVHSHGAGPGLTTLTLFIIFVLGPCESLIPLMVVPAMTRSWTLLAAVVTIFGILTISTMVGAVIVGYRGLGLVTIRRLECHADVLAGLVIAASGAAVLVLGV